MMKDTLAEEPTILAVDDTEDNLDLLEFVMKRKPVKFLRAKSGRECLALAREKNPDVILLDIQMPEMDGFETFRLLRASAMTAKIPVVFLTATRKDADSIEKGLELGAEGYLTKPIDPEELLVRVRMLVRIKRAEMELERTKADFMAMLVHDLRSPLNGIRSVVDFLREIRDQGRELNADHLNLLNAASESTRRMLGLINNILDLSKFEAGNMSLEKSTAPIKPLIESACREMAVQFKQKNITLETAYADGLPDTVMDAGKMGQVIMNLLSNAFKFTAGGGRVTIDVTQEEEYSAPANATVPSLCVTVTDSGVGIPAEEIPLLFERYRQVSTSKTAKQKGTGLGLSICKLIVEAHGGSIKVESEVGKYSKFRFTIPIGSSSVTNASAQ